MRGAALLLVVLGCERPPSAGGWTEVEVVEAAGVDFWDVSVTGDRAVAVGEYETGQGAARVIDGDAWAVIDAPELPALHDVFAAAPDDAWAASADATGPSLWRWDGTSWSSVELPEGLLSVRDVWGTGPDDVWIAAGFDGGVADRARALHWDGSALTEHRDFFQVAGLVDDGLTSLLLTAGCSRTVSDAWLVGNVSGELEDHGISFHFDGEEWRAHPVGEPRDVVCLETDTWLLVADGSGVGRWQRGLWETSFRIEQDGGPHPARVASVDGAAGTLWAVGDEGTTREARSPQAWRLDDGAMGRTVVGAATRESPEVALPLLRALYETPTGTVRALGADGLVLEHAGTP